ncbi:MAG: hypothetical protein AAGH48_01570, partial [Pseudomonadota bacterium]
VFTALFDVCKKRGDPQILPYLLAYFVRYQLDVQSAFYKVRAADHRRAASRNLRIGAAGTVLVTLSAGAAVQGPWSAFGVCGVVGAALIAFSVTREDVGQDRRNAERYARTLDALRGLLAEKDGVETAAHAGNFAAVGEYIAAVNEQLSLEHRQWLDAGESTRDALERLKTALSDNSTLDRQSGG